MFNSPTSVSIHLYFHASDAGCIALKCRQENCNRKCRLSDSWSIKDF